MTKRTNSLQKLGQETNGFVSPSSVFLSEPMGVDNDIALLIFDIENPSPQLFVISCEIEDYGTT